MSRATRTINAVWFALGLPELGMPKAKRGFRNYLLAHAADLQRDTEMIIAAYYDYRAKRLKERLGG